MMKAILNGVVIAESDATIYLEGYHYFPIDSVDSGALSRSPMTSLCIWKGIARYFDVTAAGQRARAAGWHYPQPYPWIRKIRHHVAFWGQVEVIP